MSSLLVAGYKAHELSIFSDKDDKVTVIKAAIQADLIHYVEEGVDWLVFTGDLGFGFWTFEVAQTLRQSGYDLQCAVILPFADQGANWSEANKLKLDQMRQADYVTYAFETYQAPYQFKSYQAWLLDRTQAAYLFYDEEHTTRLQYLVDAIQNKPDYSYKQLDFETLQAVADDYFDQADNS